ncbi:jg3007, partial [Pararge aegeria aegeria]
EISEVLRGVVILVDVGAETRALALRAALTALGASVVPSWSPLVTHLVWTQGGCRSIRAKARAFACQLVSPLWVEACAAEGRKLPERIFPAPTRPSDLPSPATLRRFLVCFRKLIGWCGWVYICRLEVFMYIIQQ